MRLLRQGIPAKRATVLVLVALLALVSFTVASAQAGVPEPISEEGEKTRDLYFFILALGTVVFVIVEGALIYALIRFRKRPDRDPEQIHGSTILELTWTGIPVLIVAAIFTASFITLDAIENKADPEDLTIEVIGFQWQWDFVYQANDLGPGSDPNAEGSFDILGTPDELPTFVVPVGEQIEFKLVASEVIHSFYVPATLFKLDLIPGRDNRFTHTFIETGTFEGQCAEFCGLDHARMRFFLRVVTREEFDEWVAEQLAAAAPDPTEAPSEEPTTEPTSEATEEPTDEATEEPTGDATDEPTAEATGEGEGN